MKPQKTFSSYPWTIFVLLSDLEFSVSHKNLQILEKITNQNTDFSSSFSQTFLGDLQSRTE